MTELRWEGKYLGAASGNDRKTSPVKLALPFQTIETVNESIEQCTSLFAAPTPRSEWRNRFIWGDKKYVLPSLLPEFAGKVNLIYIDPPFGWKKSNRSLSTPAGICRKRCPFRFPANCSTARAPCSTTRPVTTTLNWPSPNF